MSIELDLQIIVPDEEREKLLLLMDQAKADIENYYHDNPNASPDFPLTHDQPDVGQINLFYHLTPAPAPFNSGVSYYSFQTVGATTAQQQFTFNGGLATRILVAASNAGNTKGLSAETFHLLTIGGANSTTNTTNSDFSSASVGTGVAGNVLTVQLNGEAGETINWKVIVIAASA